jgi:hypothetical protein
MAITRDYKRYFRFGWENGFLIFSYNYQEWDMNQTGVITLEQMTEIYRIYKVKQR